MANSVKTIEGTMLEGWEKQETIAGIPYYVNHTEEVTQWNHPELEKLLHILEDYNAVKYAAYRMALKLRHAQKLLKLNLIQLPLATSVLEDHGYSKELNNEPIDCSQMKNLLLDLYTKAYKQLQFTAEPSVVAEVLQNLLFFIFDINRNKGLKVVQVKAALAMFCAGRLQDKFSYITEQFVKYGGVTKRCLHILLEILAKIPESFGEGLSFGLQWVPAAVHSCLSLSGNAVTDVTFIKWILLEPQTLVWLSTHYRMSVAENVQHPTRCNVCKIHPIAGLRYRCLHCFGYNLCQHCFLYGFVSKRHKLKHPLQEYCQVISPWEETKTALQALRSKLHLSQRPRKSYMTVDYIPVPEESKISEKSEDLAVEKIPKSLNTEDKEDTSDKSNVTIPGVTCNGIDAKYPSELQSIIVRLEDENRQLYQEIERLHALSENGKSESQSSSQTDCNHRGMLLSRQEVLEDHTYQLELQVHRLKHLLKCLQSSCQNNPPDTAAVTPHGKSNLGHYESTPATRNGQPFHLQNLSRFIKLQEGLEMLENISKGVDEQKATNNIENHVSVSVRRSFMKNKKKHRTFSFSGSFASPDSSKPILKDIQNTCNSDMKQTKGSAFAESQYTFRDLTSFLETASCRSNSKPTLPKLSPAQRSGLSEVDAELEAIVKCLEKLFPSKMKFDDSHERNNMEAIEGAVPQQNYAIAESIRL